MSMFGSVGSTVYVDAKTAINTLRSDITAVIDRAKAFIATEEQAMETKMAQISELQSQVDEHKSNVADAKQAVPAIV